MYSVRIGNMELCTRLTFDSAKRAAEEDAGVGELSWNYHPVSFWYSFENVDGYEIPVTYGIYEVDNG